VKKIKKIDGGSAWIKLVEILKECFVSSSGLVNMSQLFQRSNLPRYTPKLEIKQIKKITSSEKK
jgi:hypothetical protein